MNGYAKPIRLGLTVRADMLETVAGYQAHDVMRELAFALRMTDENDPDALRWLATLCERRVDDLEEEGGGRNMTEKTASARLEELRIELRAERISYGEIAELQDLADHIEPGDVELLEAAGVPEFEDDNEEVD